MTLSVSPNQSDIQSVLRSFLLSVLPAAGSDGNPIDVIAGQVNRVPEPHGTDFVVMTPIRRARLATNLDFYDAFANQASFTQQTDVVFQLDVHSANILDSADMAQTISTMFRDSYATTFFAGNNSNVIPLLADDPKQIPFMNAENQYETRWVIEARVQANQTVSGAPQDFCISAEITLYDASLIRIVAGDSWSDGFSPGYGG
jgi:hypothetical protein